CSANRVKTNALGASVAGSALTAASDKQSRIRKPSWFAEPMAAAIDLLFPPHCAACETACEPRWDGPLFCSSCDSQLAISRRPTCPRCALVCSEADLPPGPCGDCRSRKLLFAAARTIGPYQAELQKAVRKAKH